VAWIELQRASDPGPQSVRQRLEAAAVRDRPRRREHVGERVGCLVFGEQPAEHQRERDDADLRHVGALIESRLCDGRRQRHPQLFPVPLGRVVQLPERGAEDVFGDHHARVRGDDEALRTDGAVRDVGRVLVQHRHRRHELADEMQRGVDVDGDRPLVGRRQQLRQAHAAGHVGDDGERRAGVVQPIDAADAGEVGVTEIGKPSGALAQRELERRNRRELSAETQQFDRFTATASIGDAAAFTESIVEVVRRRYSGCNSRIHMRISVSEDPRNAQTVPTATKAVLRANPCKGGVLACTDAMMQAGALTRPVSELEFCRYGIRVYCDPVRFSGERSS
jgi:hypothetical protein